MRRTLIWLILILLLIYALSIMTRLVPPQPRYDDRGDLRAELWLQEHPDIVKRAREAVHATQTP
jgi:hypothetical protein